MHALEIGNPQKAALFLVRENRTKGLLTSKKDRIGLRNAFYISRVMLVKASIKFSILPPDKLNFTSVKWDNTPPTKTICLPTAEAR